MSGRVSSTLRAPDVDNDAVRSSLSPCSSRGGSGGVSPSSTWRRSGTVVERRRIIFRREILLAPAERCSFERRRPPFPKSFFSALCGVSCGRNGLREFWNRMPELLFLLE